MSTRGLSKWSKRNRLSSAFTLTFLTLFSILFWGGQTLHAAQVTLAWDANSDPVAGYRLYYGHASGNYQSNVDVGSTTTHTWSGLADGQTYHFAATAYDASNNQSDYSEELVCHTITPSSGTGGSVSPSSTVFVTSGGSQTFTISPSAGFRVSNVLVDGQSVGPVTNYSFTGVTTPRAITASFVPDTTYYTITASVTSGGGSISPSGSVSVSSGGSQTFSITPSTGYRVNSVLVNGVSVGAVSSYAISNVTENKTITASFTPITYTITASVTSGGGSISPSGSVSVNSGGSKTFNVSPSTGYRVSDVLVNGVSVGAVSSYEISNVTGNKTITASFTPITYTITAGVTGGGGSISPTGAVQLNSGSSKTFTITPSANYQIDKLLVDGQAVTSSTSYTFASVTSNRTISVSFKSTNAQPVADAGPDQTVSEVTVVTLQGSNSTDADNGILSHLWQQTGGPTVQLSSTTAANPTFTAPDVGPGGVALTFRLTVTDGLQATASDTCIVNVSWVNTPPVAHAGEDQTVNEWSNVTLDGSRSTDVDDSIASCSWKQTKGPTVQLTDANQAVVSFVAPNVSAKGKTLAFELTVTDQHGLKSTDSCIVNISWVDDPPAANAGPDQTVVEQDAAVLDGMASTDDDAIVSYRWKQTAGTPVTLSDPTSPTPQFIAPSIVGARSRAAISEMLTFSLTVTDTSGLESEDVCQVSITKREGLDLSGSWLSSSYDGLRFRGTLQLKSGGTLKAGSFQVSFYLSNDGETRTRLIKTASIRSMRAGSTKNLTLSLKDGALVGQSIIAEIDATQAIGELDEGNNESALGVQQTSFRPVRNK